MPDGPNLERRGESNLVRSNQLELDSKEQVLPDLEILTTIASIASWKKWMGQITLYCDHESKRFFDRLGMLELWDHVDTDVLQSISKAMETSIFGVGAKLWVQKHLQVPYTVTDTDAYFTQPVSEFFEDYDLIASHRDDETNCDQKFQSMMLTAIFKDIVEYFREYLDLDIVQSIAKKYKINPLTLI